MNCITSDDVINIACDEYGWIQTDETMYLTYDPDKWDLFFIHPDHPTWELKARDLYSDFPTFAIEYQQGVAKEFGFYTAEGYVSEEDKIRGLEEVLELHAAGNYDWMDLPNEQIWGSDTPPGRW